MKLVLLLTVLCGCAYHLTEATTEDDGNFSFSTKPALDWLQDMLPDSNMAHSRKKRFLGLPLGSNLEVKWSLNFPFDTFTFYKAKFQLALPIKVPFPAGLIVGGGEGGKHHERKRRDVEDMIPLQDSLQEPLQESSEPEHKRQKREARQERSSVYGYLEAAFEKASGNGRGCLLRAICDVAEAPFDQGLLGEMINTLLTASLAGRPEDPSEGAEYDQFIEAELHGRLNGKCEERYNKCKSSPFDLIPEIVHTVI